jgi:hypothetical protein
MPLSRYRSRRTVFAVISAISMLLLLAACGGETAPATPTPGSGSSGLAQDKASLIASLEKSGLTVTEEGSVEQPFLSVTGTSLKVDSEYIQVFEYPDEAAAQKDAAKIAPDGSIEGYRIDWLGPPHFYRVGSMIVIYPGTDQKVLTALETALGKPFAAVT